MGAAFGAAGAVIVAAWLVESKQRVVENMAPVLTMLFTPLFAVMLAAAAIVYAVTGLGGAFDRELVDVFDALLMVVLALVLYGMSAGEPSTVAGLDASSRHCSLQLIASRASYASPKARPTSRPALSP